MDTDTSIRAVDKDYLEHLERKLRLLKDPKKATAKQFISDIASQKDHLLFKLLTAPSCTTSGFDDNFVVDAPITPNYLQRKIAPHTCAVNKQELVHLVKSDLVQKIKEEEEDKFEALSIEQPVTIVDVNIQPTPKKKEKEDMSCQPKVFSDRYFSSFRDGCQLHVLRKPQNDSDLAEDDSYEETDQHILAISVYGKVMFKDHTDNIINLRRLLEEESTNANNTLEVVCADVSSEGDDDCLALLLTFWVELNELCIPIRYFGALFKICYQTNYSIQLTSKLSLSDDEHLAPVALCRLTDKFAYNSEHHFCIAFPVAKEVSAYVVQSGTYGVEQLTSDDAFSLFPEISLVALPGAATRSTAASTATDSHRWVAIGYDSGLVVFSVSKVETNSIVDRKPIKFCAPISVLQILPSAHSFGEETGSPEKLECRLLVSSTIGPASIWRYWVEDEALKWESECILENSHLFDTITCSCVQNELIAIGTFSGSVLFYTMPFYGDGHMESSIVTQIDINAPVVSLKTLDNSEICVLSAAGLHIVGRPRDSQPLTVK